MRNPSYLLSKTSLKPVELSNSSKIIVFFELVLLIIVSSAYYQNDTTLSSAGDRLILQIVALLSLAVIVITIIYHKRTVSRYDVILAISVLFYWIFILISSDFSDARLSTLFLLAFCFFSIDEKAMSFYYLKKLFVFICFFGIIAYFSYYLGLPIPFKTFPYYLKDTGYYINYFGIVLYRGGAVTSFSLRLCGIFNEPGLLGTYAAFALCADRCNPKKIENYILFLAGLLTFSVAFLILLVVYILLSLLINQKIKMFVSVIVIGFMGYYIVPKMPFENENITILINRLSFVSGRWAADNRSNAALDSLLNQTLHGPYVFFGHGDGYVYNSGIESVLSIKKFIVEYGILGCAVIYLPIAYNALKRAASNLYEVAFVMVYFASIYQRPGIYLPASFILLFGGLAYDSLVYSERQLWSK